MQCNSVGILHTSLSPFIANKLKLLSHCSNQITSLLNKRLISFLFLFNFTTESIPMGNAANNLDRVINRIIFGKNTLDGWPSSDLSICRDRRAIQKEDQNRNLCSVIDAVFFYSIRNNFFLSVQIHNNSDNHR